MERYNALDFYIKEGLTIIPIRSNTKIGFKNWLDTKLTEEEIKHHNGNFGWNVDYGYVAVDVCSKNYDKNGIESFKRFAKDCDIDEDVIKKMVSVGTPSGGFHLYIKLPQPYITKMENGEIKISSNPKDDKGKEIYPGIDFHTRGKYVVIPPSKIDDKEYKFIQTEKIFNESSSQMLNLIDKSFIIKKPNIFRDIWEYIKSKKADFWLPFIAIIVTLLIAIFETSNTDYRTTPHISPEPAPHIPPEPAPHIPPEPAPHIPPEPAPYIPRKPVPDIPPETIPHIKPETIPHILPKTIPSIQWASIDGDTIKSSTGNTVHLYGIDAPELKQLCYTNSKVWQCGRKSKQMLQNFISNKEISCELMDIDIYDRNIEDCAVNGKSISEYMVENGWAVAYTRYSNKYKDAELKAKKNKLGVWSADCFIEPERWRRGDRCPN